MEFEHMIFCAVAIVLLGLFMTVASINTADK